MAVDQIPPIGLEDRIALLLPLSQQLRDEGGDPSPMTGLRVREHVLEIVLQCNDAIVMAGFF